ncbi:MAG: response regulator [Microscillaceae bacterium]|nr:response regulator [Microscillaceae bacterium]
MDSMIKILLIEDSEDDAMLIQREFIKSQIVQVCTRIETKERLIEMLHRENWDIVISDYTLPQLDGLTALHLVNQISPGLPFILVSGKVGEELAVEVMKAGADDYIMKDNLKRLAPAVLRAINEAEIRKRHQLAEIKIRENEARLKALFDNSLQGILLLDKNLKIMWLNKVAKEIVREFSGNIANLGDSMINFIYPQNKQALTEFHQAALQGNRIEHDWEITENRWFNLQYLPLYYENGDVFGVCVSFMEISERKKNELKLQEKNETLKKYAFITSHNLRKPLANILGLISLLDLKKFPDPDDADIICNLKISAQELDDVIHETNHLLKKKDFDDE